MELLNSGSLLDKRQLVEIVSPKASRSISLGPGNQALNSSPRLKEHETMYSAAEFQQTIV